ncbi:MAG: amidohydrolase family protein [Pseudomonadota bacterium]
MTIRLALIVCVVLLLGCQITPTSTQANSFAFVNVTLIDATHGTRPNMTVVIADEKIQQVSPTAATTLPATLQQVDATSGFLIPGLWDMHVHITYEPELESRMFDLFLAHGITSVRDTGGRLNEVLSWRERARATPTQAPRVFVAGPLIDGDQPVYDGTGGLPDLSLAAPSPSEVERIVDLLANAGVDLLKAYEMLTPETFMALMERAAHHDLPVTGHIPLSMDAISVSEAGLRSIEHYRNIPLACAKNWDELKLRREQLLAEPEESGAKRRRKLHEDQRPEAITNYDGPTCEKVMTALAENGVWQIPTLTLNVLSKTQEFATKEWQTHFDLLPDSIANRWRTSIKGITASPAPTQWLALANWTEMITPKMLEAGVTILPGTDTPIFFLTPGISLHQELVSMVEFGMTPAQALAAATYESARYFEVEEEVGDIAPGKIADLILLNENPLLDIRSTQKIRNVVRHGRLYDEAQLEVLRNK